MQRDCSAVYSGLEQKKEGKREEYNGVYRNILGKEFSVVRDGITDHKSKWAAKYR